MKEDLNGTIPSKIRGIQIGAVDDQTAHPTVICIVFSFIQLTNVGTIFFVIFIIDVISYAEYHHNKQNESILKSTRQMREKYLQICSII